MTQQHPQQLAPDAHTGDRLTRLEVGHQTLQATVQRLADLQSEQAEIQIREHGQTRKEIMTLSERFASSGKPNYQVILGTLSFLLLAGAALFSPLYFRIQETERDMGNLAEKFHVHEILPIHPVAAAIMEEREKSRAIEMDMRDKLNRTQHDLLKLEVKQP